MNGISNNADFSYIKQQFFSSPSSLTGKSSHIQMIKNLYFFLIQNKQNNFIREQVYPYFITQISQVPFIHKFSSFLFFYDATSTLSYRAISLKSQYSKSQKSVNVFFSPSNSKQDFLQVKTKLRRQQSRHVIPMKGNQYEEKEILRTNSKLNDQLLFVMFIYLCLEQKNINKNQLKGGKKLSRIKQFINQIDEQLGEQFINQIKKRWWGNNQKAKNQNKKERKLKEQNKERKNEKQMKKQFEFFQFFK
ncbi:hypothetical protein ABPG74_004029 [Tetrahymena malaccensis]